MLLIPGSDDAMIGTSHAFLEHLLQPQCLANGISEIDTDITYLAYSINKAHVKN
jgi:hypothetical protein